MPATVAPSAVLAANLDALGPRNADVAAALRAARPRRDVTAEPTGDGVPGVTAAGSPLCSRHRPLAEASRLADRADLVERAVVVVLGFGAGWHVRELARRFGRAGVLVVFEPDVALLRAVLERIDHASWLKGASVLLVTDPDDRGTLARKLEGAESVIAQGVGFLEHPASRRRMGDGGRRFTATFRELVAATRTTFLTTLMRARDTVGNLLLNLDHYAAGPGVADLRDAARGHPAVVVSAGPSLARNVARLAPAAVRQRFVIIAAQTALRPLAAAGVRPHFVTALDFHEISKRFYEGLAPQDVGDATLVAEPKAHPVILDAFPGPVRCCASDFLDRVLGDLKRPMGALPAGATVAHLALYLARHLGCDPIVLVGQDLAFSEGLYYTPGTVIDDVWAPELSCFNTIEMMQWQRIARHRAHLSRVRDVRGRTVYTDAQMLAYLQQFERDFAACTADGIRIIDATEGGAPKQHATALPLADVLERYGTDPLPPLPAPAAGAGRKRLDAVRRRVGRVASDMDALRTTSTRTAALLRRMLADAGDPGRMARHFEQLDRLRAAVQQRFEAFEILNYLNQLAVFKRFRADRRLHMQRDLDTTARRRAQLKRDLDNVVWTADAAGEMTGLLRRCVGVLDGRDVAAGAAPRTRAGAAAGKARGAVAALVPADPHRNGLGVERSLAAPFRGRPVLQATLERLGRSAALRSIIVVAPRDFDVEALLDRQRIGLPVIVERCDGSPFGPEQAAVAAARLWCDTAWRGGIAGMSVYDEVLCPQVMSRIMRRRGLAAALLAGPDWPLVDVAGEGGCDAIVARHRELPRQHRLVFNQAPPGLGACLVSADLMEQLARRTRLSTVGALLVYQPHAPQADPIAKSANVRIDHRVRRAALRATFDAPRHRRRLEALPDGELTAPQVVAALQRQATDVPDPLPRHLVVEAFPQRRSTGFLAASPEAARRPPLSLELARRLFAAVADAGDVAVTLAGAGDPLLHPDLEGLVRLAREAGARGVHVRTELSGDRRETDRLLACGADVVSVDLHADGAETYRRMMGVDRFDAVLANLDYLVAQRRCLTDHPPAAALGLPWVVPRLARCAATCGELDAFFDRWSAALGAAVIDPLPAAAGDDELLRPPVPPRAAAAEAQRTMTVLSDGTVTGGGDGEVIGNLRDEPPDRLWRNRTRSCPFHRARVAPVNQGNSKS